MKPPLPASAPWQAPELHPALVNTGNTSLRKLQSAISLDFITLTRVAVWLVPTVAVIVAIPSPTARTQPLSSILATVGSEDPKLRLVGQIGRGYSRATGDHDQALTGLWSGENDMRWLNG